MEQLNYNLDENEDVRSAIQIIFNAFSIDRQKLEAATCERDALLIRLKEIENTSSSHEILNDESRRKRAKTKSTNLNDLLCVSPHQENNHQEPSQESTNVDDSSCVSTDRENNDNDISQEFVQNGQTWDSEDLFLDSIFSLNDQK